MSEHAASGARDDSPGHVPVMPAEVVDLLDPKPGQVVLDCTLGRGGHAGLIMPRLSPGGRYVGLDADPGNLDYVRSMNADPPVALELRHRNFADARDVLEELGLPGVDGLLADLGFASSQMDDPARGMSFTHEGPLDMRLDLTQSLTAEQLVNTLDQHDLADLIFKYGEERFSRRIARKIVEARADHPITTTRQLATLCAAAYGSRRYRSRIDPATRTFQALRIAVNDELARLESLLSQLPDLLNAGGTAVIISFHSLEDRLVKHAFRDLAADNRATVLTKKPLRAQESEVARNPRSRSAKLRAIRWI